MDRILLKNTDLQVSRVCFGTMTFGGQTNASDAASMIDVCRDRGINFLDTANIYNKGVSEEILGGILSGRRKDWILATKVRSKMGDGPDMEGLSRAAIHRAIDDSLRRLQTDYVDLYYLHQPDRSVPIEESLDAMNDLVKQGKVRYVAASNYAAWEMVEMHGISSSKGGTPPVLSQPMYNLIARGVEQEFLPMCQKFGISNIVYNPLAGGLLTGKHRREAPIAGTRFDKNRMYLDRYWHEATLDAVDELQKIASGARRSLLSLALNWLYHHTPIECIILGASKVEHLEQNLDALREGPLDGSVLEACDQVWTMLRGPAPKYNR